MTPEECAERTTPAVSGLASYFMLDGATYKQGAEQGFAGLDFHAAGRAWRDELVTLCGAALASIG